MDFVRNVKVFAWANINYSAHQRVMRWGSVLLNASDLFLQCTSYIPKIIRVSNMFVTCNDLLSCSLILLTAIQFDRYTYVRLICYFQLTKITRTFNRIRYDICLDNDANIESMQLPEYSNEVRCERQIFDYTYNCNTMHSAHYTRTSTRI